MTLDLLVISRETIKPSSPTATHLRTYKLSNIDQYSPPFSVPIILFYSVGRDGDTKVSDRLKDSFSETLTLFYPLGGKVVDNDTIDCDDSGVEYWETEIKSRLDEFLSNPVADEVDQLLPTYLHCRMSTETQLQIQVSTFECGGMAIGARISHKVADAATLCSFVNTWATKTSGTNKAVTPRFVSAALFPPRQVSQFAPSDVGLPVQPRLVSKRFVFDSSDITLLKAKSAVTLHPTRVQVVTALMWKCLMNASSKLRYRKSHVLNIAVNLRRRMVPALPENSFGNLIIGAMLSSERGAELHSLVELLRKAVRKFDANYVKNLEKNDGVATFHHSLIQSYIQSAEGELGLHTITSWCRFPFYDADFGWGKPIWVSSLNVAHQNVVILTDTKNGDGIEALVTLDEEDMAIFECEEELLSFASPY
ncbi:hypothetical protein IFM89_014291 [Coptis chinensis]|uniref:Uncharacterized protein n=1 Tax=Coptis chinensis TaxID=261450 RepID=A0A835HVP0_9MAGN|nr:hypothetical protein IFM89_014291 [Coptis chinensis]